MRAHLSATTNPFLASASTKIMAYLDAALRRYYDDMHAWQTTRLGIELSLL